MAETVVGVLTTLLGCVDLFFGLGVTGRGIFASLEELSEVLLGTIGHGEGSGLRKLIFALVESVIGVAATLLGCVDLFFGLGVTAEGVLVTLEELSKVPSGTIGHGEGSGSVKLFFVMGEVSVVGVAAILLGCVDLFFGLGVTGRGVLGTLEELSKVLLGTIGDREGSGSVNIFLVMAETVVGVLTTLLGCVDLFFGLGVTAGGVLVTLEELSKVLSGTIGHGEGSGSVNLFSVMAETVVGIVTILLGFVDLFFGLGVTGRGIFSSLEELSEVLLGAIGHGEGSESVKLFFVMGEVSVVGVAAILLGCVDLFFGLGVTGRGVLGTLEELSKVLLGTIGDREGSGSVNIFLVMAETVVGVLTTLLGCVGLFFGLGMTAVGVLATVFDSVNFFPGSLDETGEELFAALLCSGLSREVKSYSFTPCISWNIVTFFVVFLSLKSACNDSITLL